MRGFVITFDAIVALSLFFVAVILISSEGLQPSTPRGVYIKQLTLDVLTVMEKTDRLGILVDGDGSAVRELLQATPELACIQVTVYDSDGNLIGTVTKSGCGPYGRELQSASMPFVHEGKPYLARAESWYRKEST